MLSKFAMALIANEYFKISLAANKIYKNFIEFFYENNYYESEIVDNLNDLFEVLKDDLNVFVEYPYVDKVFRDSFIVISLQNISSIQEIV